MSQPIVTLRPLTRADLATITPWFEDADTRRYLGGADWPAAMLDHAERAIAETFRGAVQTAAHHYLAEVDGRAVGYIDCGTFDRATVYAGEAPDGPVITESIELATGSVAFAVDPAVRRRGVGRAMIAALLARPELAFVELFDAVVEPENVACRRCLERAGFCARSPEPDYEGFLYYRAGPAIPDPIASAAGSARSGQKSTGAFPRFEYPHVASHGRMQKPVPLPLAQTRPRRVTPSSSSTISRGSLRPSSIAIASLIRVPGVAVSGSASTKSRAGASSEALSGRPLRSIAPTNCAPSASSTVRTVGRANAARTVATGESPGRVLGRASITSPTVSPTASSTVIVRSTSLLAAMV
jgi:ribosomal protein S18 acetylase RimI-like enzyme